MGIDKRGRFLMTEAELGQIFRELDSISHIIEREPGKVHPGSELGCQKSYYETRVAALEPEFELRDKEKYESIFRKFNPENDLGTFDRTEGRTVKLESNNMKDNLSIQIDNSKEGRMNKEMTSYLQKMRSADLNEFDISVNLYKHLYRPNDNKWPQNELIVKSFADGFNDVVSEREIFNDAWTKGKREFDKGGGIQIGNKCHPTLISKNNLKEIFFNQTLYNYDNKTSNKMGKPKGMIQHETVKDANISRDYADKVKEFRDKTNLDDYKSVPSSTRKFYKDFLQIRTLKAKCKDNFKSLGTSYSVDRNFIDKQKTYHRQTTKVAKDDDNTEVGQYSLYKNHIFID